MTDSPISFRTRLARLGWALITVYMAGLGLYLLLYTLSGTRLWPVALLANFSHWLLLPAFGVLPLALWRRRMALAAYSAAIALVFVILFGGLFVPRLRAAASPAPTLRVMAYNLNAGNATSDRLLPLIADANAAIVGLVELHDPQAEALATLPSYPYQIAYPGGIHGIGLLSRYPILEHEVFAFRPGEMPHLRARLDVDGVPLTVIVAHPPPPALHADGYRAAPHMTADVTALAQMAAAHAPAILLGDFNLTDQSAEYALLPAAGLTDAFRAAGWGFGLTWPSRPLRGVLPVPPLVRIDYIWLTDGLAPVGAWVGGHAGSDHLPVIADVAWQP